MDKHNRLVEASFLITFFFVYFYYFEANYFTTLKWVLSYIDINQPQGYMYSPPEACGSFLMGVTGCEGICVLF